ncbi:hypothetical protein SISSUDRAFT_985153 [Sistotremastrum suecicum HHB10207 ss-3]|uniref:tRNA(Ile)-lysidine synthetase n=1 Tax=Sistotremastrum suecicum HHB10207 ss-3 TaxID=1314776 RepID=A0A166E744_9AGAM|nr:hypothetical protein SISSUDRAFT_985153 [Sistotremastrum suecicum HHB10207 ss-3]
MSLTPISLQEFRVLLNSCRPPNGWPSKIGVAFSGGPDSACLLHLLKTLFVTCSSSEQLPSQVVAITVDHRLQPASVQASLQCREMAQSLGVPHRLEVVKWGCHPFPPLPTNAVESTGRDARYYLLHNAMVSGDLSLMAMGHHLDDQVETMIMRDDQGSQILGLAGMRKCRRWGMGATLDSKSLKWYGASGMSKWIVRPFLSVSKARILATCDALKIDYIIDETNFQPSLTPRNMIRSQLAEALPSQPVKHSQTQLPELGRPPAVEFNDILECEGRPTSALYSRVSQAGDFRDGCDAAGISKPLLSRHTNLIASSVAEFLSTNVVPSPESSLCMIIPNDEISDAHKQAVLLRVLRYISPFPWGSPHAEARRKTRSLKNLADRIWSPSSLVARQPFTQGAMVMWTPVDVLNVSGRVRFTNKTREPLNNGWLASRLPPSRQYGSGSLDEDITGNVRKALVANIAVLELLWDCRYIIKIRPSLLSHPVRVSLLEGGSTMVVSTQGRYLQPEVVVRQERAKAEETVLARYSNSGQETNGSRQAVEFKWIRTLDVL